jgi:hypothetical protein
VFKGVTSLLIIPYLPAAVIRSNFFPHHIPQGDDRILVWVLIALTILTPLFVFYLLRRYTKEGFKKGVHIIIMSLLMFVIHPLVFYLYALTQDFPFGTDPVTTNHILNTFPLSSLSFAFFGIFIDRIVLAKATAAKRV